MITLMATIKVAILLNHCLRGKKTLSVFCSGTKSLCLNTIKASIEV